MGFKEIGRSNLEKAVLLILFLGMLVFSIVNYNMQKTSMKREVLYHELATLRLGINMFALLEGRFPKNLIEYAIATYNMPGDDKNYRYVESIQVNRDGQLVDPFENPYVYEENKHWVYSSTPGYNDW